MFEESLFSVVPSMIYERDLQDNVCLPGRCLP